MTGIAIPMHALACHPASRPAAVRLVRAGVCRVAGGALALRFLLDGETTHVAIPAPREPRRTDGLWRHTCFECFIATGGSAYVEFNFSPSGEWAAYAFHAYRAAADLPPAFDPRIAVAGSAGALELEATIPAAVLPRPDSTGRWRAGLSAVVEETAGTVTYWALRHASGRPDFHHGEAFALEL